MRGFYQDTKDGPQSGPGMLRVRRALSRASNRFGTRREGSLRGPDIPEEPHDDGLVHQPPGLFGAGTQEAQILVLQLSGLCIWCLVQDPEENLIRQVECLALHVIGEAVLEKLGSMPLRAQERPSSRGRGLWEGLPYFDGRAVNWILAVKEVPLLPPNRRLGPLHRAEQPVAVALVLAVLGVG